MMNDRLHWDQALLRAARRAGNSGWLRAAVAAFVIILVQAAVLPSAGWASDYENPGTNGARLEVDMDDGTVPPEDTQHLINGIGFIPNQPVEVFECPEAFPADPRQDCDRSGVAVSDANGAFEAKVHISGWIATKNTYCASIGTSQCFLFAATYDLNTGERTSDAQHHLCFGIDFAWLWFPTQYFPEDQPHADCAGPLPSVVPTTTTVPLSGQWQPSAPMNVPRRHVATAVGNDGRIYALGGTSAPYGWGGDTGDALDSVEVFDPCGRRKWSFVAPMPKARVKFAAATGPDGRIYAIGGRDKVNGTPLADVDAYDPVTNTWSAVARLSVPRSDLLAATGPDGLIYAIGGMVAGGSGVNGVSTQMVEAYDVTTNRWTQVTPTTNSHTNQGATTGPDGRIYAIAGGMDEGDFYRDTPWPNGNESYRPGTGGVPGTWQKEPAPVHETSSDKVDAAAVITAPNGLIYAVGGVSNREWFPSFAGVWVLDPVAKTWTIAPEALTTPRMQLGAAAGKDGRIYAIGGVDYKTFYPSPDPAADPAEASTESARVAPSSCPAALAPADFDGNHLTDYSVFRPSSGTWFAKDGLTAGWGTDGDIPVPADYDGDLRVDVAVFRPSNGVWFVKDGQTLAYGTQGDIPAPADYDGDGRADIAVFRPSNGVWFVHYSSGGDAALAWGTSGDVAVPADYDGDGRADVAVFRNGTWFIHPASGAPDITVNYGTSGDIPVVADYDADHTADIAVFRPSTGTWFLRHSGDGAEEAFAWGTSGDMPVTGDYNGDGIADPAVFRPSTGTWFVETGAIASWGAGTDIPLPLPAAVRMTYFSG